jgi:hypothetical protein
MVESRARASSLGEEGSGQIETTQELCDGQA